MKLKKWIKFAVIASVVLVVIYILTGLKSKEEGNFTSELEADGEGMVLRIYNNNEVAISLKCSQLEQVEKDKDQMKDIEGTILKKGRLDKDIKVSGLNGYVTNNKHDFFIQDNAKIISDDFTMRSHSFFLKDQAEMHTKKKVHYETKNLKGVARAGMEFFLKINVLKFFKTRGHYKRDDRDFEF
ncbi:MAG: hypothetical protein GY765_21775, partial [bacterium]|nr:hypothetical protein [bacterium]